MKLSRLMMLSGLMMSVSVFSSQSFAATKNCPANFDIDKSTPCKCTSHKTIQCEPKGELLYTHTHGINMSENTLHTKSGAMVKCEGKTWGVKIVSGHIGFRCLK